MLVLIFNPSYIYNAVPKYIFFGNFLIIPKSTSLYHIEYIMTLEFTFSNGFLPCSHNFHEPCWVFVEQKWSCLFTMKPLWGALMSQNLWGILLILCVITICSVKRWSEGYGFNRGKVVALSSDPLKFIMEHFSCFS